MLSSISLSLVIEHDPYFELHGVRVGQSHEEQPGGMDDDDTDGRATGTGMAPTDAPADGTSMAPTDAPADGTSMPPTDAPADGTSMAPTDAPAGDDDDDDDDHGSGAGGLAVW